LLGRGLIIKPKGVIFMSALLILVALVLGTSSTLDVSAAPKESPSNADCQNDPGAGIELCCWYESNPDESEMPGAALQKVCQVCYSDKSCDDPYVASKLGPKGGHNLTTQLDQTDLASPENPVIPPKGPTNVTSGGSSGQMSGQSEEKSNASLGIIDKKPSKQLQSKSLKSDLGDAKLPPVGDKVLPPDNITPSGINVQTVVTFNSITVHNKHEGLASGDGEYDLVAYVQGKKVDLTSASGPGSGLMDVSQGETVSFKQGNVAITEIPNNVPLSIFTVGSEVDDCGRSPFPDSIQQTLPIFFDPQLDWLSEISNLQGSMNSYSQFGEISPLLGGKDSGCSDFHLKNIVVSQNYNDILGTINELYDPPGYGVGPHEVKSSNGDFTLRYTISTGEGCNASIC
jgi:hypothetical protein